MEKGESNLRQLPSVRARVYVYTCVCVCVCVCERERYVRVCVSVIHVIKIFSTAIFDATLPDSVSTLVTRIQNASVCHGVHVPM